MATVSQMPVQVLSVYPAKTEEETYFAQDSENTIVRSRKGGASHVAEMPFIYGYKFGSGKMTETEKHMEQMS